jgi:hypothetical protein
VHAHPVVRAPFWRDVLCSDYELRSACSVRALPPPGASQSPTRFSTGGHVPSDGMSRRSERGPRQDGGLNGSPQ